MFEAPGLVVEVHEGVLGPGVVFALTFDDPDAIVPVPPGGDGAVRLLPLVVDQDPPGTGELGSLRDRGIIRLTRYPILALWEPGSSRRRLPDNRSQLS